MQHILEETDGGSWTIPEVQNFAKRRLRRTESDNSQPFLGMKSGHNSEKVLGFGALHFDILEVKVFVYSSTSKDLDKDGMARARVMDGWWG